MPASRIGGLLACAAACACFAGPAHGQLTLPAGFADTVVVSGLHQPVAFAFVPGPGDRPVRTLIVEQKFAHLRLAVGTQLAPAPPFQQIPDVDWPPAERGVLALALDPRWPAKPFVYVVYTSTQSAIHLARFRMIGDLAFATDGVIAMDPASRMLVLADVPDQNPNHNGSTLHFAADSLLWMSTGDDQTGCPAQDSTSLAGKLLRLDVRALPDSGAGPAPKAALAPPDNPYAGSPNENARLVWCLGLRNPFRFHVDPMDGAVFIADVGQGRWEEVDRVTTPANLGWPWFEGPDPFGTCAPPPAAPLQGPIVSVGHPDAIALISMGVYRAPPGASEPFPLEYEGTCFMTDHYGGWVRCVGFDGTAWVPRFAPGQPTGADWANGATGIVDAAVGREGALWYLRASANFDFNTGSLRRLRFVTAIDTTAAAPGAARGLAFALASGQPTTGPVRLRFELARAGAVSLTVHDVSGRRVRTLGSGWFAAGLHGAEWNGRDERGRPVAPGVYTARLAADGAIRQVKIVRVP